MSDLRGEILPFLQEFKSSIVKLTSFMKNSENSSTTLTRCLAREELAEMIKLSRTRLEQYKSVPGISIIKTEIEELSDMVEDAVDLAKEFDDLCGYELDLSGPLAPLTSTSYKRPREEDISFEQDMKRHRKFESDQKANEHEYLTKGLSEMSNFLTSWIDNMNDYSKNLGILLKKKNYISICQMRVSLEGELAHVSKLMRTVEDMLKRVQEIYGSPRLVASSNPVHVVFTLVKDAKSKMGKLADMIDETTFALEEWSMDVKHDCSNTPPSPEPTINVLEIKPPMPPIPSYDVSDIPDLSSIEELKHVSKPRKKSVTENDLKQKLLEIRLKDLLDDDVSKKREVVSKINNYNTNLAVIKSIEGKIEQKMKEISAQSKAVKTKINKKQPIIGDRKNRMTTDQILENMEGLDTFTGDERSLDNTTTDKNLPEVIALHKSINELKELRAIYKTADETVDEMMEDMLNSI